MNETNPTPTWGSRFFGFLLKALYILSGAVGGAAQRWYEVSVHKQNQSPSVAHAPTDQTQVAADHYDEDGSVDDDTPTGRREFTLWVWKEQGIDELHENGDQLYKMTMAFPNALIAEGPEVFYRKVIGFCEHVIEDAHDQIDSEEVSGDTD